MKNTTFYVFIFILGISLCISGFKRVINFESILVESWCYNAGSYLGGVLRSILGIYLIEKAYQRPKRGVSI